MSCSAHSPETAYRWRGHQRQLIAASKRKRADGGPQPDTGVFAGRYGGRTALSHAVRPIQQQQHVDAHESCWDQAEAGERGVASAYVRRVQEETPKALLSR